MQDEKKNGKYKTMKKKGLLNRFSKPTLITRNKTQKNIF